MPAWATRQDPISETKAQGGTAVHSCNSSHVSETPSQKQKKSQSRIRGIPQWSDCLGRSSPSFYPSAKKKKKSHSKSNICTHFFPCSLQTTHCVGSRVTVALAGSPPGALCCFFFLASNLNPPNLSLPNT
jgi:hypothetical protein